MLIVSSRQEQEEDTSGRLDIVFCVSRVLYNRSTWLALCSRDHQSIIVSKLLWECCQGHFGRAQSNGGDVAELLLVFTGLVHHGRR